MPLPKTGSLRQHLPQRLPWEPWIVVVPLIVAQWIGTALFATRTHHNGWLFYHGGDQTWYFTTSWIFGAGHIPETFVGYGWSLSIPYIQRLNKTGTQNLYNGATPYMKYWWFDKA